MKNSKSYKFFDHTADILFEAYGKNFTEALENAAHAMFSVIGDAKEKEEVKVKVSAPDRESLVVRFLETLLAEADIRELVFSRVKIEKFGGKPFEIEATAFGEKKRPRDSVKAVTFHELQVKEEKGKCSIRVLLDV